MQIPQPQAHLHEEFPYFFLIERSVHLFLQILADIAIFAILHNDVNRVPLYKGIKIFDNILALNFGHDGCLQYRLFFLM